MNCKTLLNYLKQYMINTILKSRNPATNNYSLHLNRFPLNFIDFPGFLDYILFPNIRQILIYIFLKLHFTFLKAENKSKPFKSIQKSYDTLF